MSSADGLVGVAVAKAALTQMPDGMSLDELVAAVADRAQTSEASARAAVLQKVDDGAYRVTDEGKVERGEPEKKPLTAQDVFKAMMRDRIAPALRALGFKGSRLTYQLPAPDHYAFLGFQHSPHNSSAEVQFTVNLWVVSKAAWAEYVSQEEAPTKLPRGGVDYRKLGGWHERIGLVMPDRTDIWWKVWDAPHRHQPAQIIDAIERHALPALKARVAQSV